MLDKRKSVINVSLDIYIAIKYYDVLPYVKLTNSANNLIKKAIPPTAPKPRSTRRKCVM